jgi:hypothetical protein
MIPEERFLELVGVFAGMPDVSTPTSGRRFGSGALKTNGKIFAMLAHDRLVVKLPRSRVDELVEAGDGVRFDANKGNPMKEWFSVDPASSLDWVSLAREGLEHVSPE